MSTERIRGHGTVGVYEWMCGGTGEPAYPEIELDGEEALILCAGCNRLAPFQNGCRWIRTGGDEALRELFLGAMSVNAGAEVFSRMADLVVESIRELEAAGHPDRAERVRAKFQRLADGLPEIPEAEIDTRDLVKGDRS